MFVPMTRKLYLGIIVAAAFGISIFFAPLGIVDATGDPLDIKKAKVSTKNNNLKEAIIETFGHIPKNGVAIGYGVITDDFPASIIVSTMHPGVLDSELQKGNINSPVWHNHYVALNAASVDCASGIEVADISYESPGKVDVEGKKIELRNIQTGPQNFHFGLAPNSLHSLTVGAPSGSVVSFELLPMTGAGGLEHVCVIPHEIFTP
jgi:hypothetical protein